MRQSRSIISSLPGRPLVNCFVLNYFWAVSFCSVNYLGISMLANWQLFLINFLRNVGTNTCKWFEFKQCYNIVGAKLFRRNFIYLRADVTNWSPLDFVSLLSKSLINSVVGSSIFNIKSMVVKASWWFDDSKSGKRSWKLKREKKNKLFSLYGFVRRCCDITKN